MPTADRPAQRGRLQSSPFAGFPAGAQAVPLPAAIFTTLIPAMDDVAELVVTMYAAAAVQRLRRFPRLLEVDALRSERPLIETLARLLPTEEVDATFSRGLAASVERGALLRVEVRDGGRGRDFVTLNTPADRRAVERLRLGAASGLPAPARAATAGSPQPRGAPNVYALYESTVGPVTPQIAEELTEAEGLYPLAWIEDAFREAAELNKRSWRYVKRILERWHNEGRDDEAIERHSRWRRDSRFEHLIRH